MNDLLKKICQKKREEIKITKSRCSLSSLEKLLPDKSNKGFKILVQKSQINKKNNIIAEIKKQSPSAGEIIKDFIPENIAIQYEQSGAGAISILTETSFFKGHIDHLSSIRQKTNLPLLRKDFIIDPYQIFESKVCKADAILLIVTILSDKEITEFIKIADEIGLDCIIETHTKNELQRALKFNYPIIGINNRNLNNLSININNTLELIKKIPSEFNIIGESGINSRSDIQNYNQSGVFNFLIGEKLLTSKNINLKFRELLKND